MSVFVDALFECESTDAQAFRVGARNGHRWCHLIADTDDELHAFAARLGMRRAWFQAPPKASHPHYDLTPGRRAKAVALGAFEVDGRTLAQLMRAHRAIRSGNAVQVFKAGVHDRIAAALGWPVEQARGFSLLALRDLVRPVDPGLADEIGRAQASGRVLLQGDE